MVETATPGVERDCLGCSPHRLQVPGEVVGCRSRPGVVHDPDRLFVFRMVGWTQKFVVVWTFRETSGG